MQNLYPDLALGNSLYYCGFKPKSENLIFFTGFYMMRGHLTT